MPASRNISVDIVRGLAIFIMVPANMAASVYAEPHAFWFRVASSFAAPTFITVAGMMIVLGAGARDHGWSYYLTRGALLVGVGALIDALMFQLVPFQSFDVLYLIGIAYPLTYFFVRLPRIWQWVTIALIFLAAPLLQWKFGYSDHPGEYFLWGPDAGTREVVPRHPTGVLQHLFIDGWFPIFPWLGMSFAGAMIAQIFFAPTRQTPYREMVFAGAVLLIVGIVAWAAYPGAAYERNGYTEMFYPATPGFLLTSCGLLLVLLWTFHWAPEWPIFAPLRWLGECSLLMYVLHIAIIAYLLEPQFPDKPLGTFLLINFATVCALAIIALAVRRMRAAWPHRPFAVRFMLGG
jgi:uncharacterized membrane protein